MNKVLAKSSDFTITQVGRGKGVAVRIRRRDGWSIPWEFAEARTAATGLDVLAERRFWEASQLSAAARAAANLSRRA